MVQAKVTLSPVTLPDYARATLRAPFTLPPFSLYRAKRQSIAYLYFLNLWLCGRGSNPEIW
jgi:hypothetical protein